MVSIHSGESQWIYNQRSVQENAHSITMNGNVSVAGWVLTLVTIPFLDLRPDSQIARIRVKLI